MRGAQPLAALIVVLAVAAASANASAQEAPPTPVPAPPPSAPPATPPTQEPQPAPAPEAQAPAPAPATPAAPAPDRAATSPPQAAPAPDAALDARYKVRIMEGVLEKAVLQAALLMNQQLRTVSPELVQLTGAARARGYRLDGYGLFFDVEVPAAMRQTMGWTVRVMRQRDEDVRQALTVLKSLAASLEGQARADADRAVGQLERYVQPARLPAAPRPATAGAGGTPVAATAAEAAAPAVPPAEPPPAPDEAAAAPVRVNPLLLQNPDLAYEVEVREAIIAAMVEWGASLPIAPTEWLTVAARDNQDVVIPGEAADIVTIIMRVKGSDLADFRAGRATVAELRKRVEVREF